MKPDDIKADNYIDFDIEKYDEDSDFENGDHVRLSAGINTSTLASKTGLATLKTHVDNFNVVKLKTVPADLCELSNVLNNDVVRKTV